MGLETAHSPNAEEISTIYWVVLVLAAVLAIAVNAGLVWCIARFRGGRGREPSRVRGTARVQWRTGLILSLLTAALFVAGVAYAEQAEDVQEDPLKVRAVGQQWLWRYEYPAPGAASETSEASTKSGQGESFADVFSYYELVVPVDRTVSLDIESTDVVHRWWVPELGGKFDAIPGRTNTTWFRADEEGIYEGASAAFSGGAYATMRTRVRVVSADEYEQWLAQQAAGIQAAQAAVQEQIAAEAGASGKPGEGGEEGE